MKPKALFLLSERSLRKVSDEAVRSWIDERYDAVWVTPEDGDWSGIDLAPLLTEAEAVFTSWGTPFLSEELLAGAPRLKALAHAAGSVKLQFPPGAYDRGIRIFTANKRLSHAVSEYCLGTLLTLMRGYHRYNEWMHKGAWKHPSIPQGWELAGSRIGFVSGGATAQGFIRLLRPFDVELLMYDPFMSEAKARELGVALVPLEEAMAQRIVSIHAPKMPETRGMITRELLARIPDGAILINSARAAVVDTQALIDELKSGRFSAAIDVFDEEPLPADSPLRGLPNVLLTPHIAGDTVQGHRQLLRTVAEDVWKALQGSATSHEIPRNMFSKLA